MYLKSFTEPYILNNFTFNEAKEEISFILEMLFNYTYKDFLLNKQLETWQIKKVKDVIKERVSTKKPIQQILERAFFYSRIFFVNKYTLIPRPETELLVKRVLEEINFSKEAEILDMCTGSGCIGITLMIEKTGIKTDLSDIQPEAIEIAQKNARFHNVLNGINFIQSDLFNNIHKKYNVIVSNPPYIPLKEKENLQTEVRDFEPQIALFAKDDEGIEFYEKIIKDAPKHLKQNGIIAFETGIKQSKKVKLLLKENGFSDIKITKDFNNIDRVITASII